MCAGVYSRMILRGCRNDSSQSRETVLELLKPGGVLVYSTCSLEPEENEEVVAQLLNEFKDLQLLEKRLVTPFRHGFDGAFARKAQAHSLTERLHPSAPVESLDSYARSAVR